MHQAAEEFRLRRGLDDYISRANLEKGLANLSSIEQSILDDVGITPNQAMERLEDFYDSWVKTRFSQASGDLPKGHTLRADEDMVVRLSDLEAIAKFCKTDASPLCLEYYIENLKMKLSRQFNSFNYSICSNSRTGCVQVPKSLKLLEQFTEDGVQRTVVRHITECDLHQNAAIRQFARSYNLVLREEFQHAFLQIGSDGNFVTYVLTRSEIDRWAAKVAGSPELAKRLDDYYVEIGAAPWNFADSDAETLSRSILRDTYNWEWDIYVTPILAARNKEGLRTAAAFTSNYPVRLKYLAGNEDELAAQLGVSVAELHEFAVRNGKRHMDPGLELDELRAAFDAVGHQ
jgi:hypothetical protein